MSVAAARETGQQSAPVGQTANAPVIARASLVPVIAREMCQHAPVDQTASAPRDVARHSAPNVVSFYVMLRLIPTFLPSTSWPCLYNKCFILSPRVLPSFSLSLSTRNCFTSTFLSSSSPSLTLCYTADCRCGPDCKCTSDCKGQCCSCCCKEDGSACTCGPDCSDGQCCICCCCKGDGSAKCICGPDCKCTKGCCQAQCTKCSKFLRLVPTFIPLCPIHA